NIVYSAAELVAHRHVEIEASTSGLKRTENEDTAKEKQELASAYANLHKQLSLHRIERQAGRAIAIWHKELQAAEVLRKDGKFESFGFSRDGKLYLEYYEALFLLELNRLQLEYHGMIMSVEQAYILLLCETASDKYNNYLVYSALMRAGYIVVKHQVPVATIISADCIWALLEASLWQKPVPAHIKESAYFESANHKMLMYKQQIISPSMIVNNEQHSDFQFDTRKRKVNFESDQQSNCKRTCLSQSKSLVDTLLSESNYLRFQELFAQLDIVQLQAATDQELLTDSSLRTFQISFDLHFHSEGFKRSAPNSPSFSVIILPPKEPFPTHNELIKCQRQQLPLSGAPLLIVSVSESKQIQAFLYYIS
ncbi:CG5626, partial [Drosophila busckii]